LILSLFENNFSEIETVQITEKTVNPQGERVSPHDFQLLKVLGKGGYGKVRRKENSTINCVYINRFSKYEKFVVVIKVKYSR
jgi:p70 ribosomal S6 kinase